MQRLAFSAVLTATAVLVAAPAAAADRRPVEPTADMPVYRLSNLQRSTGEFGKPVIEFDYVRTKDGTGSPRLVARTKAGVSSITFGPSFAAKSDHVRLRKMIGVGDDLSDVEFWLEVGSDPAHMVSNTVRIGDPGAATTPRPMTAAERSSAATRQARMTPPTSLPAGFVAVSDLNRLTPGMSAKVGSNGGWVDGEVLRASANESHVIVKVDGAPRPVKLQQWLAFDPAVLAKVAEDRSQFVPSVRLAPRSMLPMPEGTVPVPPNRPIPVRTEVLYEKFNTFQSGTVVEDNGRFLTVRTEDRRESLYPRASLLMQEADASGLPELEPDPADIARKEAAAAREADRMSARERIERRRAERAARMKELLGTTGGGSTDREAPLRDYPIDGVRMLPGAEVVPEDLTIPDGTAMGAVWGRKWRRLVSVGDSVSGPVTIAWRDFGNRKERVERSQLVMQSMEVRTLRRLAAKAEEAATADEPVAESPLRTWSDATGKFEITARFRAIRDGNVLLTDEDGEELEIALEQLSEADRRYAEILADRQELGRF